MHYTEP